MDDTSSYLFGEVNMIRQVWQTSTLVYVFKKTHKLCNFSDPTQKR